MVCTALVVLAVCCSAMAQEMVWQIGKFDDASREFHDSFGVDYKNPASDVEYVVGKSSAQDWLRFQPGPANGLAGGREHPFHIHFDLPSQPAGAYTFKVAVLYETPRRSALLLNVNGHAGIFYFHPTLDYGAGDWEGTFVPQTSRAERNISIPPDWLKAGANTFTLTAVDEPSTPEMALGDIAPGISGIMYDALALLHSNHAGAEQIHLTAAPTIFFRSHADTMDEVVTACADVPGGATVPANLALKTGRAVQAHSVKSAMEFGDFCFDFDVPEWAGELQSSVTAGDQHVSALLKARKKWTLDIVPHEHLDVGFTDYRAKVAELQSQSLDGVLDILPAHPEFRWTMDGSWVAEQFAAGRSPQRTAQLMQAVRDGKIVLPAQFANQHTGVASLEGLARSLYFSHSLAERFKVPVGAANITDVPSYSWSYASILHDAGVRYFAAASNSWRAPIMLLGRWNEKSPFYWEGPDGGRVLMWYSRAYLQLASMFGVSPQVEAVHDALPVFLQAYDRADYHSNSVILFGSQLENTVLDRGQVTLPARWAAMYAYPKLRFSTFEEAMSKLETDFGPDNLKTNRGDFGPYWEDGFTSGADATAQHRANQQRIVTAEQMGALPSLLNPTLRPNAEYLKDAWHNLLLFDEHTWTSVAASTAPESDEARIQLALKKAETTRAQDDIEQSIQRSWAQLESMIAPKENSIAVFNSLAWPRSGWVEADLAEGQQILDPVTSQPVVQVAERVEPGNRLPGFGGPPVRVRFMASDIPASGYKLFSIGAGNPPQSRSLNSPETVLENRFYKITLDASSASIRSVWDKELNRELVDAASPFKFATYIYVTGADDVPNNSLYRYGAGLPKPVLQTHLEEHGHLLKFERSDLGQTAVLAGEDTETPSIVTTIFLPKDEKRIDLKFDVKKSATLHKEAAYISFPLLVANPEFAYDTQNGWVDPAKDELAGGSREWYACQHWFGVHDNSESVAVVPIDAPMITFGDIVRGAWPSSFGPQSSTIFSWLMSNYWNTNFAAEQGGTFTFRYSLVSGAQFDAGTLTRFATETMTPLESDMVPARDDEKSLPRSAGFLSVSNPDVAISTWKLAEDGSGSILRLTEIAGKQSRIHLALPHLQVLRAWNCSLLEDCKDELPVLANGVDLEMHPYQIRTVKISTQPLPEAQP
jgi:alpha-mannosidase